MSVICTHVKGWQILVNFDEVLNRPSNSADNTINHVHNSTGCNLVSLDYPGTVDCHHLLRIDCCERKEDIY